MTKNNNPAALAAAALVLTPTAVFAQKAGMNITNILADTSYGLQYSPDAKPNYMKPFDPKKLLAGKPYILVEGFNGCQFCNKISVNLGKIRKQLDATGHSDVPIVVVNIKPETDKPEVAGYAKSYKEVGALHTMTDFGKKFFIAFPSSHAKANAFQDAIEASFNRSDPSSHGLKIAAVNAQGICTVAALGTVEGYDKSTRLVNTIVSGLGLEKGR